MDWYFARAASAAARYFRTAPRVGIEANRRLTNLDQPYLNAYFWGQPRREVQLETVNLYEAKTKLSRLVERAAAGEEIVIAKAGRPLARLVPLAKSGTRRLDLLAGQVRVAPDFDAPLPPSIASAFKGEAP